MKNKFNKNINIFFLIIIFAVSLLPLSSCNKSNMVVWDEVQTSYTANYGTVFQLPVVRVNINGFYITTEPVILDAKNEQVDVYEHQFYVNSKSNYTLYYQYEYEGVVGKSESYIITVENNGKPIIQLPLQTEYVVRIGDTFNIPLENIEVFLPEGEPSEETLTYEVLFGDQKVEVNEDASFVVENKGLYNVVFTAYTGADIKEEQSIVVYGDDRSRYVLADFEDEYGTIDIQKFSTGKRCTAYTPAVLNTDPKFTRENSSGSLKLVRNPYTVYNTLCFSPEVDLEEGETASITFWMYLDTPRTDTYVNYLRLKVTDSSTPSVIIDNIYGVDSLTNMGSQWIPCTFEIDSTHKFPLLIELFSGGANDSNRFSFDVYFDDFVLTQDAENIPGAFKLSLDENENEKEFDITFIKEDLVKVEGQTDYLIKAVKVSDNSEVKIDNGKIKIKENEPIILKYYRNDVQVIKTTYIYAEKDNPDSLTTYKWDESSIISIGNNNRVSADELDIDLPDGIDSVYKISKNNSSAKPSIIFKNIDLDIKNNSRLAFKLYVPESLWVPNLGDDINPDYQSCPFGFTGMSNDYDKNKPVVKAYYNGKSIESNYQSGAVYIRTSSYKGKWIDVVIDFSTTRDLNLAGLGLWFNNYHDPQKGAEKDPEGFDSYILLTDMVLSENNSPVIGNFDISNLNQGDSYKLSNIKIYDENLTTVYKYIEYENELINVSDKDEIVFEYSGVYKLKIIAFDNYGNYSFVEKEIRF